MRFKGHQNTSRNFIRSDFGPGDSVLGGSEVGSLSFFLFGGMAQRGGAAYLMHLFIRDFSNRMEKCTCGIYGRQDCWSDSGAMGVSSTRQCGTIRSLWWPPALMIVWSRRGGLTRAVPLRKAPAPSSLLLVLHLRQLLSHPPHEFMRWRLSPPSLCLEAAWVVLSH